MLYGLLYRSCMVALEHSSLGVLVEALQVKVGFPPVEAHAEGLGFWGLLTRV
jgi:hypothetical protein